MDENVVILNGKEYTAEELTSLHVQYKNLFKDSHYSLLVQDLCNLLSGNIPIPEGLPNEQLRERSVKKEIWYYIKEMSAE